jgi:hypothetical protein
LFASSKPNSPGPEGNMGQAAQAKAALILMLMSLCMYLISSRPVRSCIKEIIRLYTEYVA